MSTTLVPDRDHDGVPDRDIAGLSTTRTPADS